MFHIKSNWSKYKDQEGLNKYEKEIDSWNYHLSSLHSPPLFFCFCRHTITDILKRIKEPNRLAVELLYKRLL